MANYCIMRVKKLKADGNVSGAIMHAFRERDTPNADEKIENWSNLSVVGEDGKKHIPANAYEKAMARYRDTLPQKIGKGRVPCIELMITVSPEVMGRKDFNSVQYLNDCDTWARNVFGKGNVFCVVHHKDETTHHTSIFVVPKVLKTYKDGHTDEILAAKQWLGGREKMTKLQDDFFESVGKKHGLDRGRKGSKAKHQDIQKWYHKFNQFLDKLHIEPQRKNESVDEYFDRVAANWNFMTDNFNKVNQTMMTLKRERAFYEQYHDNLPALKKYVEELQLREKQKENQKNKSSGRSQ